MKLKFANILVLIALFAFSIFVRWDDLNIPMGRHHEFITGHVLTANSNYRDQGIATLHFAPAWTFNTVADRYYSGTTPFIKDANNVEYYVSYPPFCFIAAYYFQMPFGGPSVTGVRVFSLLIHLACCVLVFSILNALFKKNIKDHFCWSALVGFSVYLFAPGNLWFHCNVYFADMLVQLFVLSFAFVFIKLYRNEYSIKKASILFLVIVFLGLYTEYIMLFLASFAALFFLIKSFKNKQMLRPVFALGIGAVLSLGVTYFQLSLIDGLDSLIKSQSSRLKERSGMVEEAAEHDKSYFSRNSIVNINNHFKTNYFSVVRMVFFSVLVLLLLLVNTERRRSFLQRNKLFLILFGIISASIFTHNFAFLNFTAVHDFSTLKSSTLFALIIALLFNELRLFVTEKNDVESKMLLTLSSIAFLALIYFSIKEYHDVNNTRDFAWDQYEVGEIVKANTKGDELVFTSEFVSPMLMYYAQRRVLPIGSKEHALQITQDIKYTKLAFVKKEGEGKYLLTHMNSKGEILKEENFAVR
jgi:hypothetical protein